MDLKLVPVTQQVIRQVQINSLISSDIYIYACIYIYIYIYIFILLIKIVPERKDFISGN